MRIPFTLCAALTGAVLSGAAPAQEKSQEVLALQRAEKLAKTVFKKADWLFDYDKALERARDEGKLILVYFTRSYSP